MQKHLRWHKNAYTVLENGVFSKKPLRRPHGTERDNVLMERNSGGAVVHLVVVIGAKQLRGISRNIT